MLDAHVPRRIAQAFDLAECCVNLCCFHLGNCSDPGQFLFRPNERRAEVTDFDGTALPEKEMAARWGVMFTPTMIFLPETVAKGATAAESAVAMMPGAFGIGTTEALLTWVKDKGYESGEHFQKYLAARLAPQD